MSAKTSASSGC